MTPVFRWNGDYFGYFAGDYLFNASSKYLGWKTDDGQVRNADGSYLGEIYNENYVI